MPTFSERLAHAWNAFTSRDPTYDYRQNYEAGYAYYDRPDRVRLNGRNERSIINAVYNRIAIDVAAVKVVHAKLDQNDRYLEPINSGLNHCLNTEANLDQTGRAFMQDVAMSLMDEGCVAIVPIDTTIDPRKSASFDIKTMRTGKIIQWYPEHIKVRLYNDKTGKYEELIVPKSTTAIIENPLYSVMNEPNSTLQRLIRKLVLLDAVDEQSGAGKLDLIVQLPYAIKSDARREQAEHRRKDIEMQLAGSKYGIAYTDGTEKITQLNRSLDNNLMSQIEYLTSMLYSQLGLTEEVFKGTADETTMLNYYNRTIEPILSAIVDEMKRKFLTKTARTQHQSIIFFKDPFKLVPVNNLAEIADKFTRNEILSSNEIRGLIGFKPVDNPKADELRNRNLNATSEVDYASTNDNVEDQYLDYEDEDADYGQEPISIGDLPISEL